MFPSIQGIAKILIYKPVGYEKKAQSVQVAVGSNSELTSSTILPNPVCGKTPADSSALFVSMTCKTALDGRYVTAQALVSTKMAIAELCIFVRGECGQTDGVGGL